MDFSTINIGPVHYQYKVFVVYFFNLYLIFNRNACLQKQCRPWSDARSAASDPERPSDPGLHCLPCPVNGTLGIQRWR